MARAEVPGRVLTNPVSPRDSAIDLDPIEAAQVEVRVGERAHAAFAGHPDLVFEAKILRVPSRTFKV